MNQLLPFLLFLVLLVFWGWMLWDLANNGSITPNQKYFWAALFLFTFVVGAAFYYFRVYRPRHG